MSQRFVFIHGFNVCEFVLLWDSNNMVNVAMSHMNDNLCHFVNSVCTNSQRTHTLLKCHIPTTSLSTHDCSVILSENRGKDRETG